VLLCVAAHNSPNAVSMANMIFDYARVLVGSEGDGCLLPQVMWLAYLYFRAFCTFTTVASVLGRCQTVEVG
jgi:hypothetical protein